MVAPPPRAARRRRRPLTWLLWAGGTAAAVAWALPLVWMVSTSVKPPGQVLTRTVEWLPRTVTLVNYVKVLQKPVGHWLLNSAIVTVASTAISLTTGAMAGYALARLNFPGRATLFFLVLAVLMIPTEMTIVPLFIGVLKVGLVNSYLALIVPSLASAFSVYLFRNFFLSMPRELEDAASIDGAGRFRTFWSVALPVARPAMIAGAILLSTNYWNAFLWPLLVVFTESMKTLPVGMAGFTPGTGVGQSTQFAGYAPAMAAMTILTIPSILVFLFLQRQFIEGATSAGIKG
ncbi:MAG: carbohydrate ABC transporter permease [Bacillati bacterium ANGP1]|uniref:Carbohydrate ABC transporter permease n=1 Tax=Candidatus Segetimicrobium genomatis TaxID=2569760 RepID=A0A537J4G8_9BACT|nr:MAG: carbohydrate ABC transporter permease [Terrabacteria group bacterium ANGP1]